MHAIFKAKDSNSQEMSAGSQEERSLQVGKAQRSVSTCSAIAICSGSLKRGFGPPRLPLYNVIEPLVHQSGLFEA